MALPLSANAGCHTYLAAGLHLHTRAFIGADAGALYVAHHADAKLPAGSARRWLHFRYKFLVPDQLKRFFKDGCIVAAVVYQRCKVLVNDFVVVRKRIGRNEVAAADLIAVYAKSRSCEVQQALHYKHAMLAAGAAIRRDDCLGGEHGCELAVIMRHVVDAQQRALAVKRHGQPIRIIGAGIMQKDIMYANDAAILADCNFGIMHLVALVGGGVEVFRAVFDPFHGAVELQRGPWHQHFFRIEHHNFGSEATANEGCNHAHLLLVEF